MYVGILNKKVKLLEAQRAAILILPTGPKDRPQVIVPTALQFGLPDKSLMMTNRQLTIKVSKPPAPDLSKQL